MKLATIPRNTGVTSIKRVGNWYNVTFDGTSGYIYIDDFAKYSDYTQETIKDTTLGTLARVVNLHKKLLKRQSLSIPFHLIKLWLHQPKLQTDGI